MKLNPDCIRDILLSIEEEYISDDWLKFDSNNYTAYKRLKKYEYDVVNYHLDYCNKNGLLFDYSRNMMLAHIVKDLSPKGHELLENIRSDNNWNKVKERLFKAGSFTIQTIIQIAASVVTEAINKNLPI